MVWEYLVECRTFNLLVPSSTNSPGANLNITVYGDGPEGGVACRFTRLLCAPNLNIYFHMLFLGGVYIDSTGGTRTRFRRVKAPTSSELTQLTYAIAKRIALYLEHHGLLTNLSGGLSSGCRPDRVVESAQ